METTALPELQVNAFALAAFLLYLFIVVGIGIYATKFSSSGISEYFLAGRKLKQYVVALSAVTSGRSSWLLLGVSGMAYIRGVSAVWAVVGYISVELFLFVTVGRKLRDATEQMDSITLPDYFAARFNDQTHLLRTFAVSIIIIFMTAYIAAQFTAGGKTISASFNLQPITGVLITAGIVLIYTLLGGFLAVSLTDFIQALFMLFALLILPAIAVSQFGGIEKMIDALSEISHSLPDPFAISFGGFIGFLGIGLGSPGNPHILVRYMSIHNSSELRKSAITGTVTNVLMAWGALFTGLIGRALYPELTQIPGQDAENLYPYLAQQHLHPILFGFVIASIFAAIMSTADSQLLVAASAVVRDIYQKIVRKGRNVPERQLVLYSRLVVFFLVAAAVILGIVASKVIFWLVLFAWGGLGAAFGPALLFSLYWRKTTRTGVVAGFITGTLVTIIWNQTPFLKQIVYELVPAFLLASLAVVIGSLLTQPKSE